MRFFLLDDFLACELRALVEEVAFALNLLFIGNSVSASGIVVDLLASI